MMAVRDGNQLYNPNGTVVQEKDHIKYLGALVSKTGDINSELGRRIGYGKQELSALRTIWNQSNITLRRKVEIYQSCIVSKLLYGLQSLWLSKSQCKRLNGFYCACLRKISRIPHSFISHVTNAEVLQKTKMTPLANTLLQQQL